jgi:hypothetical protein
VAAFVVNWVVKLRLALIFGLALSSAQAVILYRTGDPAENTTAPTAPGYANSGWQYEGDWVGFLGTPIAPHFFVSAAHFGGGGTFFFQGNPYRSTQSYFDPTSDLVLWKVAEEFPLFAPLYSRTDEAGLRTIAIGRGTQRGPAILLNSVLKGWSWGAGDGVPRWGENIISGIYQVSPNFELLFANFDQVGLPNECHLSVGDSGGAAFIQDGAIWKLAGIHYSVDGPFYTDAAGNGEFFAALFDASGFYYQDGSSFVPVPGKPPVPTAFYSTRISTKLPWICSIVAEPRPGREANFATLTYTRIILPQTDVVYAVQKSTDLVSWQSVTVTDEIISTNGSVQVVKAKVAIDPGDHSVLLRLQVSRP